MKIAIMICDDTPEIIWNAFRLANMMLENKEEVSIFLNGPSVRYAALGSEQFPLADLAKTFTLSGGELLA